jgi:alpha-amylase
MPLVDAVLNHKAAADELERCRVNEVDSDDRNKVVSDPYEINGWLGFTFPGRKEKYSDMKYHWYHFTGTGKHFDMHSDFPKLTL